MPNNAIKFAPNGRRTSRSLGRLWQMLTVYAQRLDVIAL